MGTVWVLALVLKIGAHEIIIQPRFIYTDSTFAYYDCMNDKKDLEKITKIPATCFQKEMEI